MSLNERSVSATRRFDNCFILQCYVIIRFELFSGIITNSCIITYHQVSDACWRLDQLRHV